MEMRLMKNVPEVNVVYKNYVEDCLANELFTWRLDEDEEALIVEAPYREVVEDSEVGDAYRCFKKLEEPVVIGSVKCDMNSVVYDLGWNDLPDHFEDKSELRDFENRLTQRTLAFRYIGKWWFLKLADMDLVWGEMDPAEMEPHRVDEAYEPGAVPMPFFCDDLYALAEGYDYRRGETEPLPWYQHQIEAMEEELDLSWCKGTAMVIGETILSQYGLYCDGFEDEWTNLAIDDPEGDQFVPEWDKISILGDDIVLYECFSEDGYLAQQLVTRGFCEQLAIYDAELMCEEMEYDIQVIKRDPLALGVLQRDAYAVRLASDMSLLVLPLKTMMDDWMKGKRYLEYMSQVHEDHPWIGATMFRNFGRSFDIMDREGEFFVVRDREAVRGGSRYQYFCINGVDGVGGVWDDAKLIRNDRPDVAPLFQVKKDGLWGIIDVTGKVIVPIQYNAIRTSESYDGWTEKLKQYQLAVVHDLELNHFGTKQYGVLMAGGYAGRPNWEFVPEDIFAEEDTLFGTKYRVFEDDGTAINNFYAATGGKFLIADSDERREIYRYDGGYDK